MANTVEARIRITVEGDSRAVRAVADLGTASKQAKAEMGGIGTTATRAAKEAEAQIDRVTGAVSDLRQELLGLDKVNVSPKVNAPGGKLNVGSALSSGAQLLGGGSGAGQLLQTASDVEGLTKAIGGLSPVTIAAGVAVGGAALLIGELSSQAARTTEGLRNLIAGQKEYYDLLTTGTREDVQAAVKAKETQLASARAQFDELNAVIEKGYKDASQGLGVFTGAVIEAGGKLGLGGFQDIAAARTRLEDLRKEIGQLEFDTGRLNSALDSNATTTNDAAAAEERLLAARKAYDQGVISAAVETNQIFVNATKQGRTATQEQIEARLEAIAIERRGQEQLLAWLKSTFEPGNEEAAAAIKQTETNLRNLGTETTALTTVTLPLVDARKAEEDAIKRQKDALDAGKKALDEYNANAAKLSDLEKERAQVLADRAREEQRAGQISALQSRIDAAREAEAMQEREAKIADIRKEGADNEASIVSKAQDDLAQLDRDFLADRLKAQADYAREAARSEEDYGRERLRKLQDLNADLTDLAGAGDVAGFIKRQRSGLTDIARGDEDFGVEQRRRLEDFQREQQERAQDYAVRRAERQAQLRQELDENRVATQQKLEQERAANQTRLTESQRLEQELAALKQRFADEDKARAKRLEDEKYRDEVAAIKKRNAELLPVIQKGFDPAFQAIRNVGTAAANVFSDIANRVRSLFSGGSSGGRGGNTGTPPPGGQYQGSTYIAPDGTRWAQIPGGGWRKLATGLDYVPYDNFPALLHRGEMVLNAQRAEAFRGGGGTPITISFAGANFGRVATPEDLQTLEATVYQGVARAIQPQQGRN